MGVKDYYFCACCFTILSSWDLVIWIIWCTLNIFVLKLPSGDSSLWLTEWIKDFHFICSRLSFLTALFKFICVTFHCKLKISWRPSHCWCHMTCFHISISMIKNFKTANWTEAEDITLDFVLHIPILETSEDLML